MKALIADDHYLIRDALCRAIQRVAEQFTVLQAANGSEVTAILAENPDLDLVLLDLFMPGSDGFELLANLCNRYPDIPVIILSASEELKHMRKALDCGASGFIPKSTPNDLMINAIKLVLSGGVYVPHNILKSADTPVTRTANDRLLQNNPIDGLTVRQREVLVLLGEGQQNKEIARNLGLSEHTVKVHIAAVFKSLKVSNRTQAVLAAQNILKTMK